MPCGDLFSQTPRPRVCIGAPLGAHTAAQVEAHQGLFGVLLPDLDGPVRRGGEEHVRVELVPLDAAPRETENEPKTIPNGRASTCKLPPMHTNQPTNQPSKNAGFLTLKLRFNPAQAPGTPLGLLSGPRVVLEGECVEEKILSHIDTPGTKPTSATKTSMNEKYFSL